MSFSNNVMTPKQCPRNTSVFQTCLTFVWRLPSNLTMHYIASSDKCLTFHCHISRTLPKSTMEGPSTFQTSHKSWPPWSCQSTCSVSAWTRPCSVTPGCLGMQWAEPGIHWTPDAHAGLEYTTWCVNTWDMSITPTQATPNSSVCFTWFFFYWYMVHQKVVKTVRIIKWHENQKPRQMVNIAVASVRGHPLPWCWFTCRRPRRCWQCGGDQRRCSSSAVRTSGSALWGYWGMQPSDPGTHWTHAGCNSLQHGQSGSGWTLANEHTPDVIACNTANQAVDEH